MLSVSTESDPEILIVGVCVFCILYSVFVESGRGPSASSFPKATPF